MQNTQPGKRIFLSKPFFTKQEQKNCNDLFATDFGDEFFSNSKEFANELKQYVGMKNALCVSSGTAAIHLALRAFGVAAGDLVFCQSATFAASAFPITYFGAKPVFIDSEPQSWNMCPEALEKAFIWAKSIDKNPKIVIVVDTYGQSANYYEIKKVCDIYGAKIIQDSAESLGSQYLGKKSLDDDSIKILSFNLNKIITSMGGGCVLTNNELYHKKMSYWANQAKENLKYYNHLEIGYNYRMSEMSAAIGRAQLTILEQKLKMRKQIFDYYTKEFESLPLDMMPVFEKPNHWLSVVKIKEESQLTTEKIISELENENIESRNAWKPMHLQPVFRKNKFFQIKQGLSVSSEIYKKAICLPSSDDLTKQDMDKIIEIIKKCFE